MLYEYPRLELDLQPDRKATGRFNGVAREESGEIDDVQAIVQVLYIKLKLHTDGVLFDEVESQGRIHR